MGSIQFRILILLVSGLLLFISPITSNAQDNILSGNSVQIELSYNESTLKHPLRIHSEVLITTDDRLNCLVTLWNHRRDLDISQLVSELETNLIWSHDDAYTGQAWEDTHMYSLLQIPGVDHVLAKIERAAWGWTHEMSLRHAQWIAIMSKLHPEIIGLYLNDFYDEVEDGYRTEDEFRFVLGHYVDMVNEGKLAGLRIFSAYQLLDRPEYIEWAKEILSNLNCI